MTLTTLLLSLALSAADGQTAQEYQDLSARLTDDALALVASAPVDAVALFERALVANPANVDALIGLGAALDAQGKPGRSLKYYRHALALEPDNVEALSAQAQAYLNRDLPERAESNQLRIAELCGDCSAAVTVADAIADYRSSQKVAEVKDDVHGR